MGYYMGDFYARGGRNRFMGDPGFFSFLGGLAKKVAGIGASFIPGVGPAVGSAIEKIGAHSPVAAKAATYAVQMVKRGVKVAGEHPAITAAAGAGALGAAAAAIHHRGSMAAAGMGGAGGGIPHGGGRRRRMNVCNPRALRRAIRRTHSFAKLAMKTIHLVHPKKHVTFGGFRKKRKR